MYLITLLTAFHRRVVGDSTNFESCDIANAISGLVPTIRYIKIPIASRYDTSFASSLASLRSTPHSI
jgi:hypothetical protein